MDSYDSFPQIPSEDVVLGTPEGRNLSPVRRFFCLLVTFDFLFTVLLWSLCVILVKGEDNLIAAFEAEVTSYRLKLSLFDIVMCSGSRFVILLLFYALLQCTHWLPVALTTAGSCAFLLAKVFMFEWSVYSSGSPWPVLLVLSSFVLSWFEAWFLDFRVAPIERQAAIYLSRQAATVGANRIGVLPWLHDNVRAQSIRHLTSATPGGLTSYPESNFYSPLESPYHSDAENEQTGVEAMEKNRNSHHYYNGNSPEMKMWIQQGPMVAIDLINKINSDGWALERELESGDTVFSQKLHRKIFMISGSIAVPPAVVAHELFHRLEAMPNWSPAVSFCQVLQKVNDVTDVSYSVSKEGAGGVIAPRDFVTLRHYQAKSDGSHIIAMVSVKHVDKPIQPKIIRGTNGVNGWYLFSPPSQPGVTQFKWVMDADLQLPRVIPKKIIDGAFISNGLETVRCLRHTLTFTPQPEPIHVDVEIPSGGSTSNGSVPHAESVVISVEGAA